MKLKELRKLNLTELKNKLSQARKELGQLRLETSIGKIKDTNAATKKRKEIARMLTVIKEKEIIQNA